MVTTQLTTEMRHLGVNPIQKCPLFCHSECVRFCVSFTGWLAYWLAYLNSD